MTKWRKYGERAKEESPGIQVFKGSRAFETQGNTNGVKAERPMVTLRLDVATEILINR